jgi:D-alanyl-D-alanine carboxypeptidase
LFCLIFSPAPARAFDWPSGASLAEKIQVLRQEIYNVKTLIASAHSQKKTAAAAYLALNLSDNSVLAQKNSGIQHSIASITKLMSAVVALENIDSEKTITLTKKMLAPEGESPSLFAGLNISAQNLLSASLIQSTNDATEALAYFLGKEKFLALMNQKSKELGMPSTVFADVHGLDKKNRSTAADTAKLLAYIYKKHPGILSTTKSNNFWLPDAQGKLLKFLNLNNFYYLPEFVGGKTGYSPAAKQTFAGVFDINGKPVAIIVLRSSDYQSDTFNIINQLKNQSH